MVNPTYYFLVKHPEESVSRGFGSVLIPTLGHAASNFDAYRTIALDSVLNQPESLCITETDAAAALGRVIDGPITSKKDIESAESALRAILLHECVEIIIPCVKGELGKGVISYIRLDQNQRNAAAFAAFSVAPCRDILCAIEYIDVSNGEVSGSSNHASQLIGKPLESLSDCYRDLLKNTSEIASAFAMDIGAASYYTSSELTSSMKRGAAGFIDELYRRIYRPWLDIAQASPPLNIDVKLPPLLAIVLSRAPSRDQIPDVLRELRDELSVVRTELNNMNKLLERTMSQADIQAQVMRINESFDAIVPESLLTDAERRWRTITSVFNLSRPVRQLYSIAVDPLNVNHEKLQELFNTTRAAVAKNPKIVSRYVPAAKFSELLRTDSVRESVLTHFSESELRLFR